MKANQIHSHGAREPLKVIAASNGVKKLGPKEGRTMQIGDVRLTWKATGEDTGYATSFYEMDLPPDRSIALHSHPYAEVFYVVMGHTDFLRVEEQGQEEWVRCSPGDTLVAPMNALHAFHNRLGRFQREVALANIRCAEVTVPQLENWLRALGPDRNVPVVRGGFHTKGARVSFRMVFESDAIPPVTGQPWS
jgi:quercetin dioxygenase-like cupin family protein